MELTLSFEQIDALRRFIEFHTDNFTDEESAEELDELVGTDVAELHELLLNALSDAE